MHPTSGFLTVFFLILVLIFLIFNCFQFSKVVQSINDLSSLTVYHQESNKLLRKLAISRAENARKLLIDASRKTNSSDFYKKVEVEAHCEEKMRVGESGDGGKFVCNPKKVKNNCTILSLGLNNQIKFDEQIFEVTGRKCKILGADIDPQNPKTKETYRKMNGDLYIGKIPQNVTISEMLKKSGRGEVEMLKIDIEGGEFEAVEPLLKGFFVCQIFIEIHGLPSSQLKMLQILAKFGFKIFNVDENLLCPLCCEYSLINEFCMAQLGVVPLASVIPVD